MLTLAALYAGLQFLTIVGQHKDVAGTQNGVGAGPLLEVHASSKRLALHIEGIPVVGIPNVKPSVAYGQATPALGIFNGQVEYAFSKAWSFGVGETIYNQRTPLPAIQQVVSSRLAGLRLTSRYQHENKGGHFVEGLLAVVPTLRGADRYVYSNNTPTYEKPERASEVDASLAFGIHRGTNAWLFGIRTINFAAQFVNTGEGADRNVGVGPLIEWRHYFK